jgi:2-C-methyl-D-erythritol 2,4-cyclodiphosphate synthase
MSRVGLGYDSHRFAPGRPLLLGGVKIPHDLGLAGHSDADAVLHAIMDALLGAAAMGDIGQHFSDRDERWKDADSATLLEHVMALLADRGLRVGNCDVTVISEMPKLSPHKAAMQARIAQLLKVEIGAVCVKAKTNEGMGWIGAGEGLAAIAVVMLV